MLVNILRKCVCLSPILFYEFIHLGCLQSKQVKRSAFHHSYLISKAVQLATNIHRHDISILDCGIYFWIDSTLTHELQY